MRFDIRYLGSYPPVLSAVRLSVVTGASVIRTALNRTVLFIGVMVLAVVIMLAADKPPAGAQSLAEKFGGFSTDSNQPIDIEADQLKVNDVKKTAIFTGNVKAAQGKFVLRSKFLEVFYAGDASGSVKAGANGKVKKLSARGKVLITTTDQQSATSEWAVFDVIKQTIVLGDEVVLTQGGNIIKGGRLVIDLKTRQSKFENKTKKNKGRIQMKVDVSPKKAKKKN